MQNRVSELEVHKAEANKKEEELKAQVVELEEQNSSLETRLKVANER